MYQRYRTEFFIIAALVVFLARDCVTLFFALSFESLGPQSPWRVLIYGTGPAACFAICLASLCARYWIGPKKFARPLTVVSVPAENEFILRGDQIISEFLIPTLSTFPQFSGFILSEQLVMLVRRGDAEPFAVLIGNPLSLLDYRFVLARMHLDRARWRVMRHDLLQIVHPAVDIFLSPLIFRGRLESLARGPIIPELSRGESFLLMLARVSGIFGIVSLHPLPIFGSPKLWQSAISAFIRPTTVQDQVILIICSLALICLNILLFEISLERIFRRGREDRDAGPSWL